MDGDDGDDGEEGDGAGSDGSTDACWAADGCGDEHAPEGHEITGEGQDARHKRKREESSGDSPWRVGATAANRRGLRRDDHSDADYDDDEAPSDNSLTDLMVTEYEAGDDS